MIYLEDEKTILELRKKMGGEKLVVYLTYDQLNAHKKPHLDMYDFKVKAYNNGVCKVIKYKNYRKKSNTFIHQKKRLKKSTKEEKEAQKKRHVFEIKNLIKDYILCNIFTEFWTLTFDPKKFGGEVSDELAYSTMHTFLKKLRRKYGKFNYIAIPERHKSGQIHWHMVTGNLNVELIDSGKTFRNQKIYNCNEWEHGFTNVQKMRSKSKVSSYVTKYITKDLLYSPVRKHKCKYWCSKGLELPEIYAGDYSELAEIIPLHDENGALNPTHSNDICDIWLFRRPK
ncbi:rolling circle replication-associated protein [Macrococcus armenti]|uniref:rolling circle replication-associated protein n=1 Tax=Macrococcus armenti TaxID=2875764 RepID=UPI001CCC269E|nr:hypothetical protein [Macrococcus armenti]UBH14309.1 hypothetical protein LAU43_11630 [Macrococcus armenti]